MASICGSPVCAGGKPKMKFTYTGDYVVRKDGVVELLTSGTIVFLEPKVIDLFLVGGGGAGGGGVTGSSGSSNGGDGGDTIFGTLLTAKGGGGGGGLNSSPNRQGGSGGGAASYSSTAASSSFGATTGGVDGSDGTPSANTSYNANFLGKGQGATTREFGEAGGKLYSGGGGGGGSRGAFVSAYQNGAAGGAGGGGAGGNVDPSTRYSYAGEAGTPNSGGGGGGGAAYSSGSVAVGGGGGGGGITATLRKQKVTGEYVVTVGAGGVPNSTGNKQGGTGGSGIVCFRESVELPELAGTWVMNNRIYQPATAIKELVNFTMPGYTVTIYNAKGVRVAGLPTTPASIFGIWRSTDATEQYLSVYDFYSNEWGNTKDRQPAVLTFPSGATASEEFRAWLASNATKQ